MGLHLIKLIHLMLISLESIQRYVGLWIDSEFSVRHHMNYIRNKTNASLRILYLSINCLTLQVRKQIAQKLLFPIMDYGDIIYSTSETHLHPLNVVNIICRFVLRCP